MLYPEDHSNIESAVYADLRKQKLNTPIYRNQQSTDKEEYKIPGLIHTVYLPLPKDIKEILKRSVKNGIMHIELNRFI